jgi:hypothetical protein
MISSKVRLASAIASTILGGIALGLMAAGSGAAGSDAVPSPAPADGDVKRERVVPATPSRFDVCDVSFLIPPGPYSIPLARQGDDRPIISERLFKMLKDFAERGHPGVADLYHKMVITAFRFDPCGPIYPKTWSLDDPACVLPNIRIIAQARDGGQLATAALHMVFALGVKVDQDGEAIFKGEGFNPAVRDAAIRDLRAMKRRNEEAGISAVGVPLGIHPAFAESTKDPRRSDAFARELERFIRTYCNESNYFLTAMMFTVSPATLPDPAELRGKERWEWQQAFVVRRDRGGKPLPAPVLMPAPIPGTGATPETLATRQHFTADLGRRGGARVEPPPNCVHGTIRLADLATLLKPAEALDPAHLQAGMDVADFLENPDKVRVNTEDCASCHLSTPTRLHAQDHLPKPLPLKRAEAFLLDAQAAGLTGTFSNQTRSLMAGEGYRVMIFAFFKGQPSIGQRTINESLQAAHLLNRNLDQASASPPSGSR